MTETPRPAAGNVAPQAMQLPAESPFELEHVPCDFCGASETDLLVESRDHLHGQPGTFRVVACRQCGLARTDPRPTLATLPAAYPDDYIAYRLPESARRPPEGLLRWALVNYRGYPLGQPAPAALRTLAWPLARSVLRHRDAVGYFPWTGQGRLLDFGCGGGKYVARMAAAGWQAEGLDLSATAVAEAARSGLVIHQGTLPGADLPRESYDMVTMWHAIEHVPSPMATLRAIREVLRPGGRLAVVCPGLDSLPSRWFGDAWYGLDVPRHLTHFTRATLGRHVAEAGFRVERFLPIRRPALIRESLKRRAAMTGRPWHRLMARWRFVPRLLSYVATAAGRSDEIVCLARK